VRILYIAASNGEAVVERVLSEVLESGERFDAERIRRAATPEQPRLPSVTIGAPDLRAYDTLLGIMKAAQVDVAERTAQLLTRFNLEHRGYRASTPA
jgi:hypothetical protein